MLHISSCKNAQWIVHTDTFCGYQKELGVFALASVVNELAARGVEAYHIEAKIILPQHMFKSRLNGMKKHMEQAAKALAAESLSIEATQGAEAAIPMVTITAAGAAEESGLLADAALTTRAGMDVVLTKWVGLDGMLRITAEKEEALASRFTPAFLQQIQSYKPQIYALEESRIAKAMGVSVIRQVGEGGILAALHYLAQETRLGLSVEMKKMSIKQETIEVCEYFRLNPYQLTSTGCMLMVTDKGEELAGALTKAGIHSSVIGQLTQSNDKIISNGEEIRYIDRPAPDELRKIFV